MEQQLHNTRLQLRKAEHSSLIGSTDGLYSTAPTFRSVESEKLQYEDAQNARISALLGEMRPLPVTLTRKAHTTNVVSPSKEREVTGRSPVISGSYQKNNAPLRLYSSQQTVSLPKYDQLYCNTSNQSQSGILENRMNGAHTLSMNALTRREPPEYGKFVSRPTSSWLVTSSETRPSQVGWLKNSRPLAQGSLSPASYFRELESRNPSSTPIGEMAVAAVAVLSSKAAHLTSDTSSSESTLDSSTENSRSAVNPLSRCTPRQASFIAAMTRSPFKEANSNEYNQKDLSIDNYENDLKGDIQSTPLRRPSGKGSDRRQQTSRSLGILEFQSQPTSDKSLSEETRKLSGNNSASVEKKHKQKVKGSSSVLTSNCESEIKNEDGMKMIRRARPKSYVLATSVSMQDDVLSTMVNEPSSSISHDDTTSGREMPSSLMGSTSSIEHHRRPQPDASYSSSSGTGDHTSRSLNAPHPPATHRLHRFIALFNKSSDDQKAGKSRMKRSRTSLPATRFSLPGTLLERKTVERQTWVKHQEMALGGKSRKRHQWEDRWAILCRRSLYLCCEAPVNLNTESAASFELGSHMRVDVRNAIVDIAYDWLSASSHAKQRHVVRIVTQDRSEHLIELNTESEMLSWIAVLQSCSEDTQSTNDEILSKENNNHVLTDSIFHNSHSIASLASSSCSTTTSEFVQSTTTPSVHRLNELSPPIAATASVSNHTLPSSKSLGVLHSASTVSKESAQNQLIMHRYIAKNSQLHSPTANKKMGDLNSTPGSVSSATYHSNQASTSRSDGIDNGVEGGVGGTTPKTGRKWKKSKAAKQGSGGGGSSGSSQGSHATPQPVLGIRLADCPTGSEEHVPMLVQICVAVVEMHGMDTIGIYRIPGNTAAVNALKESLSNRGFDNINLQNIESLDPRWRDVNVVSSLLKMFLRKLPEPLLTDKLYPFFIDANRISTHHNRLHKLRNLLRKLPRPHYETLRYLILHLSEITKHSDVNKMECRNLALMFGPSIVRPSDDNMATMVTHMSDQCKIIETLIHYHSWMFDETSTNEDAVPEKDPADGQTSSEPGSYGVGVPTGVSAASFNDMHNLIRKANEDQAAAMMNEGKGTKIKNMLRRNSRRDKSKSKLKIESTAPAAVNPRGAAATVWSQPTPSSTSAASVESAFCGNYQERDIDAEIESRQATSDATQRFDQSPSLESSLGSLPDTSRTEPIGVGYTSTLLEDEEAARRKRQQEMYSARRIFIAGTASAPSDDQEKAAIDALANHSQHLHIANSPAFEVLSEETREKIRRMQKKQSWHDATIPFSPSSTSTKDHLKTGSPTKDLTDALSCTSDYSTTSSAPLSSSVHQNPAPLAVTCHAANSSSDYASSDPSPCGPRNASTSPATRPVNLGLSQDAQPAAMSRSQKIRLRTKAARHDPARRHTLSDVDTFKEGRLDKLARWFGLRKSTPDVSRDEESVLSGDEDGEMNQRHSLLIADSTHAPPPPVIVRTSPNELTPVSGDEQL